MYKWNRKEINSLINYLKDINSDMLEVQEDINLLKELKYKYFIDTDKKRLKNNFEFENDDYIFLKEYDSLLEPIIYKYWEENLDLNHFMPILSSKEDILDFTRSNIKNISKKWAQVLEPYISSKDWIDYRKNNRNYIKYLKYLGKFYISLSKNDNILDFMIPTHEFLHIYSTLLNNNSFYTIEAEFLSILGELITSYEMKKRFMYRYEVRKYELENYKNVIQYIKAIIIKRDVILEGISTSQKKKYLKENFDLSNFIINDIYGSSLDYNYEYVISYFLALELFEIYKLDKEKCIYTVEKIIMSNDDLDKKLKDNNITLLEHDDLYVKKIKKNIH